MIDYFAIAMILILILLVMLCFICVISLGFSVYEEIKIERRMMDK